MVNFDIAQFKAEKPIHFAKDDYINVKSGTISKAGLPEKFMDLTQIFPIFNKISSKVERLAPIVHHIINLKRLKSFFLGSVLRRQILLGCGYNGKSKVKGKVSAVMFLLQDIHYWISTGRTDWQR